jgi:predicted ATPase/DNA-binding SARP family transcriptional activator/DNA-binding CsgD family transcriptional regulator
MSGHGHGSVGGEAEAVRIWLLGGFRVSVGERTVAEDAWRLKKAASLVKLLALSSNHRLHREQAMEALWPHLGRRAASNNLRGALHAARRAFDPAAGSRYLASEDEQLVLCEGCELWVDVEAFEETAATARRSKDPAAYRAAIELYSGELLPAERYEEWAEGRREGLRRTFLSLLMELAGLYEERGQFASAVEALRRVVAQEPAREDAHAALMSVYALMGNNAEALAQYGHLEVVLCGELGTEPAASSRALKEEIAAGRFPYEGARSAGSQTGQTPHSSGRHNLPAARSSFVGREREMLELKRALAMTRLLTLTGAGGSGKTRLALEVARDLVGVYPDGVWLVELAGLTEGTLVSQAVAGALGVKEQPGQPLTDTLLQALRTKEMLLVLDNCEHLVEAAARLADALLDTCPTLRILATSREALRVAGEVKWAVPTLSSPDLRTPLSVGELEAYESARLFSERARQRDPSFALTPSNAQAVAEVCRKLEGIPLALELAAARVGTLPVEEMARRLEDSLGLLTAGSRTAVPRQRTLRGALDWSHDLLSEPERILFRRLSTFAGGWTLEAAETVGSGDDVAQGDVLGLLSGLVDKSLVVTETTAAGALLRYGMLEPVRHYAREKLEESDEAEAVWRRHATFLLVLAEEAEPRLRGPEQAAWFERLEVEHDNLRAAFSWSLERREAELGLRLGGALLFFWLWGGHLSEGRSWLEGALGMGGEATGSLRAKALEGLGNLAIMQNDFASALTVLERSLVLYREAGDGRGVARCLAALGWLALIRGENRQAAGLLEDSLARLRELDDKLGMAFVLTRLAYAAFSEEDHARALALLEEALALYREAGDARAIAMCLGLMGRGAIGQGDFERATELLEEAIVRFRSAGLTVEPYYPITLGLAMTLRGEHGRAKELIEEGLISGRESGIKLMSVGGIEVAAILAARRGEAEGVARLWGAAEGAREAIGSPLSAGERRLFEPYMATVRSQLDEARWGAAEQQGRRMTLEEAVEHVLSEREAAPSAPHGPEWPQDDEQSAPLTRREREVAALLARGLTNRQIAKELSISEHTAETHVARILKKLKVHSREQVVGVLMAQRRRSHPL